MSKPKKKINSTPSSLKNKSKKVVSNNKTQSVNTLSTTANTQLFGELSIKLQEKSANKPYSKEGVLEAWSETEGDDVDEDSYPKSRIIKRDANGQIVVTEVGDAEEEDPFSKFHNNVKFKNSNFADGVPEEYNEQLINFRNLYDNVYKRCVDTNSKTEFLETFKDAISSTEGEAILNQLKVLFNLESGKMGSIKEDPNIFSGIERADKESILSLQSTVPTKDLFAMATSFYKKTQKDFGTKNPDLKTVIAENIHNIINGNSENIFKNSTNDLSDSSKVHEKPAEHKEVDIKKKQSKKMSLSQLENLNNFFKELSLEYRQKIMHITREDVFDAFSKFELKGHLDPFQVSGFQSLSKNTGNGFNSSDFLEDCSCCNGEAHFDYEKAARKIYDALYRSEKMKDESLTDIEFNIQMCNEREYNAVDTNSRKSAYPSLPSYLASEEEAAAALNLQNHSVTDGRIKSLELHSNEIIDKCISWISANPTNNKLLKRTMTLLPQEVFSYLEDMEDSTSANIDSSKVEEHSAALVSDFASNQNLNPVGFADDEDFKNNNFSADSFYNSLKTNLINESIIDKQKQQYENLKKLSEIVWHNNSQDLKLPLNFLKDQNENLKNKVHENIDINLTAFEDKLENIKKFVENSCSDTELPDFKKLQIENVDTAEISKTQFGENRLGSLDKVISVDYESFFRDLFKDDLSSLVDLKPLNDESGVYLKSISDAVDEKGASISALVNSSNTMGSLVEKATAKNKVHENDSHTIGINEKPSIVVHSEEDNADEGEEDDEAEEEEEDDDYSDSMFEDYEEKERIYNRCKSMIRFAVQFILKERLEHAAKELEAEKKRLVLLKQLEEEEEKGSASKNKKSSKKKEKNKKKQQQLQQQELKKKEVELNKQIEEKLKNEKEAKELQRREEQRKKAEELKKKKDEQLRKKKEEQARRDEAEAKARRLKDEQKKLKEEERKQKQLAKEQEKKLKKEMKEKLKLEADAKKSKDTDDEVTSHQDLPVTVNSQLPSSSIDTSLRRKSSLVSPNALKPYMNLLESPQNVSDPMDSLLSLHSASNNALDESPNGYSTIAAPPNPLITSSFLTPPVSQGLQNPMNSTGFPGNTNASVFNNAYQPVIPNNFYHQPGNSSLLFGNLNNNNTSQFMSFMNDGVPNNTSDSSVNNGAYSFNGLWNNNSDMSLDQMKIHSSGNSLINQSSALNYNSQPSIKSDINSGNNSAVSALNNYYSGLMMNYGSNGYNSYVSQTMPNYREYNNLEMSGLDCQPSSASLLASNKNHVQSSSPDFLQQIIFRSYIDYVHKNPLEVQPIGVLKLYNFIVESLNISLLYTNFLLQLEQMTVPPLSSKYSIFLSRDSQGNITNIWFDLNKNPVLSQPANIWE